MSTESADQSWRDYPLPPEVPVPSGPIAQRFVGKVALVTGAARGQGRAEALRLAAEGADIIAVDICQQLPTTSYPGATPAQLEETARDIKALGRRVVARQVDIVDFDALNAAVTAGASELGGLNVVVANAGMTTGGRFWTIDAEHWQATLDINLTGAFHTAKAATLIMLEQGTGGAMAFTSSVSGSRGLPFLADYNAAKHGLVGLCKTMANELADYRIRVNTVHPYGVHTQLLVNEIKPLFDEFPDLRRQFAVQGHEGSSQPEDIAAAVAWIVSDEARHVTGIQLHVDRGRTNW